MRDRTPLTVCKFVRSSTIFSRGGSTTAKHNKLYLGAVQSLYECMNSHNGILPTGASRTIFTSELKETKLI